ncbi:MAG: hypothetical protein COA79_10915 [Planctomycetota bacterium]|nr:MAG: hypothetical protein COA79_10915 [Planctomycetota bacterium]
MTSGDAQSVYAECPECSASGFVEKSLIGRKIECKCGFQFEVKGKSQEKTKDKVDDKSIVEFITEIIIPKDKLSENHDRNFAVKSLKKGDSLSLKIVEDNSIGVFNLIGTFIGCLDEDCNNSLSHRIKEHKIHVNCVAMDKTEIEIQNQYHWEIKLQLTINIVVQKNIIDNDSIEGDVFKKAKSVDEKVHSVNITCPNCHRKGFVDSRLSSKKFECSCGYRFNFSDVNYIDPWKKSVETIKSKVEEVQKNYFHRGVEELEAGSFAEGYANVKRSMELNENEQNTLAYFIISCFLTKNESEISAVKSTLKDNPLAQNLSWWINTLSIAYGYKNYDMIDHLCEWFKDSFKGHFKPFERIGFYNFLFRDYEKSIKAFKTALEIIRDFKLESKEQVDYLKSMKGQAKVLYELDDIDASIQGFKDVLQIDRSDIESWKHLSQIYYTSKKYGQALKFLNGALNIKPNNIEMLYTRGVTRYELKDMKGAKADFDHVHELNPYDEDAIKYLNKINVNDEKLKKNSTKNKYNSKRKQILRSGEFSVDESIQKDEENLKRIDEIKRELRLDSRNTHLLVEKGWLQSEIGKYEDSIKSYNLALAYENYDENKSFIYNNRGLAKNATNDYYGAIADYTEALRLTDDPAGISTCYLNRAIAKGNLNDFEGALVDLKAGVKNEKDEHELAYYFYLLGEILLESGKFDESIKYLDKGIAIEKDPKKLSELYSLKGACYGSTEVYQLAIDNFKIAIEKNPDFARYQINLGYALYSKENYEEACKVYLQALSITLDPAEASSIYFLKSLANYELHDYEESLSDSNKSIDLDSENPDSYFQRGLINEEIGKIDEAKADYLKTLSINPTHDGAKNRLADLE